MSDSKALKKLAQNGDLNAQISVGILGELGLDPSITPQDSFKQWLRAAKAGDGTAMISIAEAYDFGIGTKKDPKLAEEWYLKAAEKGFTSRKKRKKEKSEIIKNAKVLFEHVLIVDDSPIGVKNVLTYLKPITNKFSEAQDGDHALTLYKKHKDIDLIVTDLHMPVMNGLELLETIRKVLKSNVPVYILTMDKQPLNIKKAKSLGVTGWILKPLSQASLEKILQVKSENAA